MVLSSSTQDIHNLEGKTELQQSTIFSHVTAERHTVTTHDG